MAVMLGKLYAALIDGGTAPDKATAAAEELAGYENRFAKLESDMLVLKWVTSTNAVLTLAVLVKLLVPGGHP